MIPSNLFTVYEDQSFPIRPSECTSDDKRAYGVGFTHKQEQPNLGEAQELEQQIVRVQEMLGELQGRYQAICSGHSLGAHVAAHSYARSPIDRDVENVDDQKHEKQKARV